jgi:L-iditol 2-dehydrogenase
MTDARMMSANVLSAPRQMKVESIPFPVMGPRDALIKVSAVGLCGSDYHIYTGEANYNVDDRGIAIPLSDHPQILGHEVTGVIEAIGAEVTDLGIGDRVVIDQGLSCVSDAREHLCEYCASGFSHQCEWYREFGITGLPGGLAEFISVPAVNLLKITSDRPAIETVMTEPLACVLHALETVMSATSRYRFDARDPADRVRCALICGAGPAGLLFIQVLRKLYGYQGTLVVSEPDPAKRELARQFGAETIDPTTSDLVDEILTLTKGRRVEFFLDAAGVGIIFEQIPSLIRIQATVLMYAHGHGGIGMEAMNAVQFRVPTLLCPCGASGGFDDDGRPSIYRKSLQLIENGTIDVGSLVTHVESGLDSVATSFNETYGSPGYIKSVTLVRGETTA